MPTQFTTQYTPRDITKKWDPTQWWTVPLDKAVSSITWGITSDDFWGNANKKASKAQQGWVNQPTTPANVPDWVSNTIGSRNEMWSLLQSVSEWMSLPVKWPISQQWSIEWSFGLPWQDPQELPWFYETEKGAVANIIESRKINPVTKDDIKKDMLYIDFNNKTARSWSWIDVDYSIPLDATRQLSAMIDLNRRNNILKFPESKEIFWELIGIAQQMKQLSESWIQQVDWQYQDLVVQYKQRLGALMEQDSKDWALPEEYKSMYKNYLDKLGKLNYAFNQSWEELKTKYSWILWKEEYLVNQPYYIDLDTEKDKWFQAKSSRLAKEELLKNPVWQQLVSSASQNDPMIKTLIARESWKSYISDYERWFLKRIDKQIWPKIRDYIESAKAVLSETEIQSQMWPILDLFNIFDNLTQRKIEDDITDYAFSQNVNLPFLWDLEWAFWWFGSQKEATEAQKLKDYEQNLLSGKQARQDIYEKVYWQSSKDSVGWQWSLSKSIKFIQWSQ